MEKNSNFFGVDLNGVADRAFDEYFSQPIVGANMKFNYASYCNMLPSKFEYDLSKPILFFF